MTESVLHIGGTDIPVTALQTVVVGSGAAGFNAALRLVEYGVRDIAIVTEGVKMGTSRNTGSDKQTYYKLNLCGDYADSPRAMAEDFFRGKCVDGDIAYAEAALSVPSFIHLCELGVPFPTNRYGEYVGYKTDHDPRARATSAGPLTSHLMTEYLERAAVKENIKIYNGCHVIRILKDGDEVVGLLALERGRTPRLFRARNVIFATGGPAGAYADTVYPVGHTGSSGVLFEAGVKGKNLTEWQFGLASTSPRWNVSGTYMQVLPRFVSVDSEGVEREFLTEAFSTFGEMLSMVFKKGYEWPFDCRKVRGGSSIIDLLVYRETRLLGRRVYLDFRRNPGGLENLPFDSLSPEAYEYLSAAGALFGTPLERLAHMNQPAIDLYMGKGVDLSAEMLEIALCAQHNNGGAEIDLFWQTDIAGLFVAGEAAGSHGVYRPGGSALNAGQVGSMRAAQYIANRRPEEPVGEETFLAAVQRDVEAELAFMAAVRRNPDNAVAVTEELRVGMSTVGGAIRNPAAITPVLSDRLAQYSALSATVGCGEDLRPVYRLKDALISEIMLLTAMKDYAEMGGKSRGSALYTDPTGEALQGFGEEFRFVLDGGEKDGVVQLVSFHGGQPTVSWRDVRPLPEGGGFFENVWREYRIHKNIY